VSESEITEFIENKIFHKTPKEVTKFLSGSNVVSRIKGYTTMHLKFDGKLYWDIETCNLFKTFYCKKSLPSDSYNRIDLLNWMTDNRKTS